MAYTFTLEDVSPDEELDWDLIDIAMELASEGDEELAALILERV